jgi:hypothetical protein
MQNYRSSKGSLLKVRRPKPGFSDLNDWRPWSPSNIMGHVFKRAMVLTEIESLRMWWLGGMSPGVTRIIEGHKMYVQWSTWR